MAHLWKTKFSRTETQRWGSKKLFVGSGNCLLCRFKFEINLSVKCTNTTTTNNKSLIKFKIWFKNLLFYHNSDRFGFKYCNHFYFYMSL